MTRAQESVRPDLVSTIIPVYNRPQLLRQAVESVLAQTWSEIEIIVSDDGSTDATSVVARELEAGHPGVVRYLANPSRGPGPARESGRLIARGEFIQYLDSDDRLLPRKFEAQIGALRKHPECGIAYGYTRLIDSQGLELAAPFKWTGQDRRSLFPGLLVDRWWCTHTPLYRRSVTDAVGPWSDLRYSQDWEYDARVGAARTLLVNCHEYVSEHRVHAGVRQTGNGAWLSALDRVRFFHGLLESARSAGSTMDSPEMRHFARWVFRHSRESALEGEEGAASLMLAIALEACGKRSLDMRIYRALANTFGWASAARSSELMRKMIPRRFGRETQRQSWMG